MVVLFILSTALHNINKMFLPKKTKVLLSTCVVHDLDLDCSGQGIFRIHIVKERKEDRRIMYKTRETFFYYYIQVFSMFLFYSETNLY